MAVTNNQSAQVLALDDLPTPNFETRDAMGRVRIMEFSLTVSGAGDANSTFDLIKLPAGQVKVLGSASIIKHSAFGTGRTLDVGHGAYRVPLATSDTAADEDALHSAADVSAAGSFIPHDELASGTKYFNSTNGVMLTAKVESAGVPDGATLKGYFLIVID